MIKLFLALAITALMNPDYSSVTVPQNIAPLNFEVQGASRVRARFESGGRSITSVGREVRVGVRRWHRFMKAAGDTVKVSVCAKIDGTWCNLEPFEFYRAEAADPYVAYRLIDPGYEIWNEMGLYQRNITNFSQSAIITNSHTGGNCMNCHSFCNKAPERMVMHMRARNAGTFITNGGKVEKLNTKTDSTISALVYPQWHPTGKYIAFSVNLTKQMFHSSDPDRIEVFDSDSDVVVYDVEKREVFSCPQLKGAPLENYPTFSPDGRKIYFTSSPMVKMPMEFDKAHFSLCAIDFDPHTRSFGQKVDTLYNARILGGSVSLPRLSPDGRYMLFVHQRFGNFGITHRDSDLYIRDMESGEMRPCDNANSGLADSFPSWSTNGRWVVFSSRRDDGLYTRLYMAHVAQDGTFGKAFILPQRKSSYYKGLMKSYNVPEFVSGRVEVSKAKLVGQARFESGTNVTYSK